MYDRVIVGWDYFLFQWPIWRGKRGRGWSLYGNGQYEGNGRLPKSGEINTHFRPFQEIFNTRVAKYMCKYCYATDGVWCVYLTYELAGFYKLWLLYTRFCARKTILDARQCTWGIMHIKEETCLLLIITWYSSRNLEIVLN